MNETFGKGAKDVAKKKGKNGRRREDEKAMGKLSGKRKSGRLVN